MTDLTRRTGSIPGPRVNRSRAVDGLIPQVYDKLRLVACRYLQSETHRDTFQPTALVHEAYLRLAGSAKVDWKGKTHFLAIAATEMRRILVEHARAAGAKKRGGAPRRITLTERLLPTRDRTVELLLLDESLQRLARRSSRQARIAELRVFAGMQNSEIADTLGVSERTIKRDWAMAKVWLARELRPEPSA